MQIITEKALLQKWAPLINHKNAPAIKSQREATVMARLLENQEMHEKRFMRTVLSEASYADPSTSQGSLTTYKPILVPMMRRVVPQLLSMKIFGVQPMSAPTGIVFAIRPGYQGSSEANRGTNRQRSNILICADATLFAVGDPCTGQTSGATGTVIYKENNTIVVNIAATAVDFQLGENIDDASPYAAAASTVAARYIPDYTDPAESNEALYKSVLVDYATFATVLAAEQSTTATHEMGFDITQTTVTARTQKLKAKYSLELAEDYSAIHGENAESELMKITSDELVLEQNLYFINYLTTVAERNAIETFSYAAADGRWLAEKAQNMISKMNRVGKKISDATRRGDPNFQVATKGVINLMQDSGRFEKKDDYVNMNGLFVGKLDGAFDVYYNVYDTTNTERTILGYIGGEKDAGIYFAPYVAITPIKTVDPESGNPILIMRTRYGLLENPFSAQAYYRELVCTGIN